MAVPFASVVSERRGLQWQPLGCCLRRLQSDQGPRGPDGLPGKARQVWDMGDPYPGKGVHGVRLGPGDRVLPHPGSWTPHNAQHPALGPCWV